MTREGGTAVNVMFSLWRPVLADVRQLPGFEALVRDLGLVDSWQTTGTRGEFCRPVGDGDFTCE